MTQRYKAQMTLFEPSSKLPVRTDVPMHPKTGYKYIFKWDTKASRQDWRSDGYRWRQNSTVTFTYDDQTCKRYYFKLHVAPGECTTEFTRHAIESPLWPQQVLVWYVGDDSVVCDYSKANCKKNKSKNLEISKLSINQDHAYLDSTIELEKLLDESLQTSKQEDDATPRFKAQMRLFEPESGLPVHNEVPIKPKTGFRYIYKWEDPSKHQDWRADGYRWRQNSTASFSYGGVKCRRYYFKLQIKPGGECTTEFTRHAIECPLYERQVLVWYQGDDSVVVDFAHGNSKDPTKGFHRTAPSVLKKMKSEKEKLPLQVYSDLVEAAPSQMERHIIDAPRDIKQVRNARKIALRATRSSLDSLFNLVGLRSGAGLVSDIHLTPNLEIIFYNTDTITNLKKTLDREDLPHQCIAYESGIEIEELRLSIISYRQTEFEETPIIPLMFMLYDRESPSGHDFLFLRLSEIVPELLTTDKLVIWSAEEEFTVNAIEKHFPNAQRSRCWFHVLQSIRAKLPSLGLEDRKDGQQYESDFIRLLHQASAVDYKTAYGQMYLKKWNKEFFDYFDLEIDPDMNRMGRWALRSLGISFQCTKQSELFSCIRKQFPLVPCKKYSPDKIVLYLLAIIEYFNVKISRSYYGKEEYTLREHLIQSCRQTDAEIPDPLTIEQAIALVRKSRTSTYEMTRKPFVTTKPPNAIQVKRAAKRKITEVDEPEDNQDSREMDINSSLVDQEVVIEEVEFEDGTVHYLIEGEGDTITLENEMTSTCPQEDSNEERNVVVLTSPVMVVVHDDVTDASFSQEVIIS